VEGLHAVGVLFTRDKCLLCVNLCVLLIFMHLFSWVFPVYVVSIYLLFYINRCICKEFLVNLMVLEFRIFRVSFPSKGLEMLQYA
jgi:hypothetical protein